MDKFILDKWKKKVKDDDDVWILGDVFCRHSKAPVSYLKNMRGHKHLIVGNHDTALLNDSRAMAYFESVDDIKVINVEKKSLVLCHYPLAEWPGSQRGNILVYGHIHANKSFTYRYMADQYGDQALNAGCMINGYEPVSLEELIINNRRFREEKE